jgi:hypothetical protein
MVKTIQILNGRSTIVVGNDGRPLARLLTLEPTAPQRRLYQLIVSQFRGHRPFPFEISDAEASHGPQVRWTLRARNATDAIRKRWVGASWIVELVSTGQRDGKPFHHVHLFMDIQRTS